jgi:ribonuclease D
MITTTADLTAFCATFGDERFITVDTEFIRERTYFPQLCLMQVATSKEAVAIDPLAGELDLTPLYDAFANERLLKVFHAAKQDIEIFVHETGRVPLPMYDTQIAAMVCGFGESASYETLVSELVGARLDKASRFTDWARRPLTQRQIDYALDDVIHLRKVFELLEKQIAEDGRSEWIAQEMAEMTLITQYRVDVDHVWQRLKVKSRSAETLQLLRATARWREEAAMRRDLPRQRVLKDDFVTQIAAMNPKSIDDLMELRGVQGQLNKDAMASLLSALDTARAAPREGWPQPEDRQKPMPAAQEGCLDQLKLLLRQRCEDEHLVPRIVADKEELEALVRGKKTFEQCHIAQGWRYEVYGKYARAVIDGKLTARVAPHKGGFGLIWQAADSAQN